MDQERCPPPRLPPPKGNLSLYPSPMFVWPTGRLLRLLERGGLRKVWEIKILKPKPMQKQGLSDRFNIPESPRTRYDMVYSHISLQNSLFQGGGGDAYGWYNILQNDRI